MIASALHAVIGGAPRHRLFLMAFAIVYAGFAASRRRLELRDLLTRRRAALAGALLLAVALMLASTTQSFRTLHRAWIGFGTPAGVPVESTD